MLKRINLNNSTILLIGIVLITIGISMGFMEYFKSKRDKVFSDMNILLYENEQPELIESEEKLEEMIEQEPVKEEQPKEFVYNFIGTLEIPKLNLKRGFLDLNSKYNNVDYNITVIKGSTFPDEENNNLILAAHSGACSICFFNNLYKLSIGDSANIRYKNVLYSYKIVKIYEVEKDGTVAIYRDYTKNVLTLITCTRNSNTKQTVYILELYNRQNI